MKPIQLLIITLCLTHVFSIGKNWALLVAGSYTYSNYRHQSDVYHAYHILTSHGIPPENIIVMAKDDIATDKENPFPGKVFNNPNGKDVYEGVKIDYKDDDVTANNLLAILKGEKEQVTGGTGRVIESTKDDNIFLYYSDHGGKNVIGMPSGGELYGSTLCNDINFMHATNKYHKMVLYIEACFSGSLFKSQLKSDIDVYATTAANPDESSYAVFCGDEAVVNGTEIGTCLGDEYSVNWMEQSEKEDLWQLTLGRQKDFVTEKTLQSNVCEYGDLSIRDEMVGDYQGHKDGTKYNKFLEFIINDEKEEKIERKKLIRVASVDNKLYYLKNKMERTRSKKDREIFLEEVKKFERAKRIIKLFDKEFKLEENLNNENIDFGCYKYVADTYKDLCGFDPDRDYQYFKYFAAYCTLNLPVYLAYGSLQQICSKI